MKPKEKYIICLACERLTDKKFCSECGCFVPAKVLIPFSECPLKKWDSLQYKKEDNSKT